MFIEDLEETLCIDGQSHVTDDKNHFDVDSLICERSTVLSEDFSFLNKRENNYLHLVLRPSRMQFVNDKYNSNINDKYEDEDSNSTMDEYLIEIGCKVTHKDKINLAL